MFNARVGKPSIRVLTSRPQIAQPPIFYCAVFVDDVVFWGRETRIDRWQREKKGGMEVVGKETVA